jgi:hypothetical protein
VNDGLGFLELVMAKGPHGPPSAKASFSSAHVLVQMVPAWISRLTLMLLVKMPAAKTSKVATRPKTSFWTRPVLTSSTSIRAAR